MWLFLKMKLKVGLSPSKKNGFTYFNENPLKVVKSAIYFVLQALIVLKTFKFLSWLFAHVQKTQWRER